MPRPAHASSPSRLYLGTSLLALATLALEVATMRLLSVVTWYHLAFFAISAALLGTTAGGVRVFLAKRPATEEDLARLLHRHTLGFALSAPLSAAALCFLPLQARPSVAAITGLLVTSAVCALPFYFAGVSIAAVLTRSGLPIGRIYAADLVGAGLGCVLAVVALNVMNTPNVMLSCGVLGAFAAALYAPASERRRTLIWSTLLTTAVLVNSVLPVGLTPRFAKGLLAPPTDYVVDRWNSISRGVVLEPLRRPPRYWGPGQNAPKENIRQSILLIDQGASSQLYEFDSPEDLEHLRYDVTNAVHLVRPRGPVCVIGAGGGRDIQSALLFGHESVLGVEVNPLIVDILTDDLKDFVGIADHPGVTLARSEARAYLERYDDRFSVIQMSLVDTDAATGVGAFALSENGLYTVEAWQIFWSRLAEDGVLSVSRWNHGEISGQTVRSLALALEVLQRAGIDEPARHVAVVTSGYVGTVLLSRSPLSDAEITLLERGAERYGFEVVLSPTRLPQDPLVRAAIEAPDLETLYSILDSSTANYRPPTDDSPFFFNQVRIAALPDLWRNGIPESLRGLRGSLVAEAVLVALLGSLLLLAIATVILPLRFWAKRYADRIAVSWSAVAYFALIGAGFMLAEIALLQRLSVFLGEPIYAISIVLFALITGTGLGSLASDRLPLTSPPWTFLFPLLIGFALFGLVWALPPLTLALQASSLQIKLLVSVALLIPLGILLGVCFPTGMRLATFEERPEGAWYWAINGITGVLASSAAVLISIHSGISTTLKIAALCYLALLVTIPGLRRSTPSGPAGGPSSGADGA